MRILFLFLTLPFLSISQLDVDVYFDFTFKGEPLEENTWYVSDAGDSLKFKTVQFFVSQPPETGKKVDAENVQLVDWKDKKSHRWPTRLSSNNNFQFTLGLDSIYHVSSNMTGDLDPSLGLYWAWQSGYIQLKIEGVSPNSTARKSRFEYHLGGYLSPFSVSRDIDLGEALSDSFDVEVKLETFFSDLNIAKKSSILIPGKEAVEQMDKAQKMFKLASNDD